MELALERWEDDGGRAGPHPWQQETAKQSAAEMPQAAITALRARGRAWVIRTLQDLAQELDVEISEPHAGEDPDAPRKETMTFHLRVGWRLRGCALEDCATDEKVRKAVESDMRTILRKYAALLQEGDLGP